MNNKKARAQPSEAAVFQFPFSDSSPFIAFKNPCLRYPEWVGSLQLKVPLVRLKESTN